MRRVFSLLILLALLSSCAGASTPAVPTIAGGGPVATLPPTGPQATPTSGASGQVTISFGAWEFERSIYEPLAKQFMEQNPGIKVVIVPLDDVMNNPAASSEPQSAVDMLRRMVTAADTLPSFGVTPEAFGTPLLLDLKPLMDADASFKQDDFYPGALERYTVKGGTWVLPRYFYVQVLSYNKNLLKNANVPEPQAGWKWPDLIGVAEQVARVNGSRVETYGYFDLSGGMLPMMADLESQGLDLARMPAQDIQLQDPKIIAAVDQFRDRMKRGVIVPPFGGSEQSMDPMQIIQDGRVAIWGEIPMLMQEGPGAQPQPLSFEVGYAPYPVGGPSDLFMNSGSDGYIISGGTAYPTESWRWIEFLSRQITDQQGPGGMMPVGNQPGRIPARQSLADTTGFWKNIDEQQAAAYKWALANQPPAPDQNPDYMAVSALSQALSQVMSDPKLETRKALADAEKWMRDMLAETQLTPTPRPDTSPVLVATPEPQEPQPGATTISFSVFGSNPGDVRRIARAFRQQHPEYFVQVRSTDTFTGPVSLTELARTSDCFIWTQAPQGDAEYKALLDIQPLLDADASFPRDDYPPAILGAYQHNGGLFGLPYAVTLRTLNYNNTLFGATGLKAPTAAWKPADFLAAAQALTSGEGDKKTYGYVPLSGAQQDLLFFIGQFGSRLTSGSGQDLRPNYTDPKTIEAIQWYIDLAKVHKVMPPINLSYRRDGPPFEDRSYELVQTGRGGMWFDMGYGMFGGGMGGGDGVTTLPAPGGGGGGPGGPNFPQPAFEVKLAALPVGGAGLRSGDFYARGFHISAGTQNPQGCWEWLKFLSGDAFLLYGDIPARTSLAQSEQFTSQAPPDRIEVYKVYADALKLPGQPGDDPNALYSTIDTYWLFKAIDEAANKNIDLAKGLGEAQKFTTAYLECLTTVQNGAKCAIQVDPNYQGFNIEDPGGGIPRG